MGFDPFGELLWWWQGQRDPESRAFDAAWGTETRRFDLGNYEPSLPGVVDEVLDALDVDPRAYTFVDLGSGKGRAVMLASRRPFRRVVGVERGRALHRRAQANLATFRARDGARCPVELVQADAATCPLPDGPLVIYLYNPFPAEVLSAVLARLPDGDHRLAYVNPKHDATLRFAGWRVRTGGGEGDVRRWRVYARP